jgi:hypothetical protein
VPTLGGMRVLAALLAFVVLVAASAARASNGELYRDPLGDTTAAPDLGEVRAENDDAGRLLFTVAVENRTRLELGDVYALWIDADLNERNGARGYEYAVVVDGGTRKVALARFDGGRWAFTRPRSLTARWRGGLVVGLGRGAIGSPVQLDFAITSASGGDSDWAPDARPDWRFQLIVSPQL